VSTESPDDASSAATNTRGFAGLRTVTLLTLVSRILGLVRDMAMAALFGNGAILDAFTVALRVPNLARRLFGEGALTAAFLPVFVRELERAGRESAWKLASAVLNLLAVTLCVLIVIGELLLWGIGRLLPSGGDGQLLIGLTAVMLPYLLLICLAAQISAVLHSLRHFTAPALSPVLLNLVWIVAVVAIAPRFTTANEQIYVVAACVVVGGLLQVTALTPTLFRHGFEYTAGWTRAHAQLREIIQAMLPVIVGLSITQINTLSDSLIAWSFSLPETAASADANGIQFLESGTASALFFGQRMYQFPLGMIGVALGTVLFPLLARHAERGRLDLLRDDLQRGLRFMISIGLPASAGLVLLSEPITSLLFQRGAFDSQDVEQTAAMISAYSSGVWAYCGLLIVHRGYYAAGDRMTPLRIGLWTMLLNLALNFALLWPLGGAGLAVATALSAMIQVAAATWLIQQRIGRFEWRGIAGVIARAAVATTAMSIVCWWTIGRFPDGDGLLPRVLQVAVPLLASILVYFFMAWLLGLKECWMLFRSSAGRPDDSDTQADSV
jgi:putative peptidoglycan lipid II flippase